MRSVALAALILASGSAVGAEEEPTREGLNCSEVAWVRSDLCNQWKRFNTLAGETWWVRFSPETGAVHTIYANHGQHFSASSGPLLARLGFSALTVDSDSGSAQTFRARVQADRPSRALLRGVAVRLLRPFLPSLGISQSDLRDLQFLDFREEPGETFTQASFEGGAVVGRTTSTPSVGHIVLGQFIDGIPVEGARVTLEIVRDPTCTSDQSDDERSYDPNAK